MIELCRSAGLPEPQFEQRSGSFVITLWRDWLTARVLAGYSLNDRQEKGIAYLKAQGRISNPEYQQLTKATKKTSTRDLSDLKIKGIVLQIGLRGPGVHYVLANNGVKKRTMGT